MLESFKFLLNPDWIVYFLKFVNGMFLYESSNLNNDVFLIVFILILCFSFSVSYVSFLNYLKLLVVFFYFIFMAYKNYMFTFILYSAYFCFFYFILFVISGFIFITLVLLLTAFRYFSMDF
jgi:hypothetical protein